MPIELDPQQNGIVHSNGQLTLAGTIDKFLSKRDRSYIERMNSDISKLSIAEETLVKEQHAIEQQIKRSEQAKRLADLKAKLKIIKQQRHEKTLQAQGVIEAALSEAAPGKRLVDVISDSIPTPPAIKRGRPHKGV